MREHRETPERRDTVLVTDVGSTTTKAMLLRRGGEGLVIEAEVSSPTTVEAPEEDVKVGIRRAVEALETETGLSLLDDGGGMSVPYLTTSSAGGGLQILVFGLTRLDTGATAEMTAQGAGGVILRTVTIDNETPPVENMRLIHLLHPDMVLMAGGVNGGAIGGVVHMAEVLSLARPLPKFGGGRIPLVFCGNVEARPFIRQVLEEDFDLHITENVRPDMFSINIEPAKREIHRLFMENVMERAPGYSALKGMVAADILPTPAAVQRMLELHEQTRDETVALMDMGGATTDIFTSMGGDTRRSVAANTGMSYSICNVMARAGVDGIMAHLPDWYGETEVRDYVASKMLRPTSVPASPEEMLLEQAVAVEGTADAWRQHREMWFRQNRIGMLDRLKQFLMYADRFRHHFFGAREGELDTRGLDLIVGTGGVVTAAEDPFRQLWMLAEGFRPAGVTAFAVEKRFRSPHLGVLSVLEPGDAARLFAGSLRHVGHMVAPTGAWTTDRLTALTVTDRASGETTSLKWGQTALLPRGGDLQMKAGIMAEIGGGPRAELSTDLPVILDCRGRGRGASEVPLACELDLEEGLSGEAFEQSVPPVGCATEEGRFHHLSRLPYEGEMLVEEGDAVEAGDVVGRNSFAPPRLYIVDLRREAGWKGAFPEGALEDGLLVSEGDEVRLGQKVFEYRDPDSRGRYVTESPVRGRVTGIEPAGLLILREIQDYDGRPHEVDVAGPLGIRPRSIRGKLKKREGDFVAAGQAIAEDVSKGVFVRAPSSGLVKKVDRKAGTVTIQYDIRPVSMRSIVSGTVSKVDPGWSATISWQGERLTCAIGFGPDSCGELVPVAEDGLPDPGEGRIAAFDRPVTAAELERLAEAGFAGVIAPSMRNGEWVRFHGRELGVALTGDEDIPFGLILTEGFGAHGASEEAADFLRRWSGKTVGLSTRTQIRAGVSRPSVLAPE
jgi:uncharacterized protein (TIGR01319 family)